MVMRCIHIFPEFDNVEIIEGIRKQHDTLYEHVRPHITLVFPFESDIETEVLKEHMQSALAGIKGFPIVMSKITATEVGGNYLFLNVKEGDESIREMHRLLYKDLLEPYKAPWLNETTYVSHITVGRIETPEELYKVYEQHKDLKDEFYSYINKVSVEIIGDDESSTIELEISLEK